MTGARMAWLSKAKSKAPKIRGAKRYAAPGPIRPESKVAHLHRIDDGTKSDEELARIIGSHPKYVAVVRLGAMRRKWKEGK